MDVTPDKQNIDKVFSNTTYYIDFYQRQYKWSDEPVKRLLDDIFFKFSIEYERHKDSDLEVEKLVEKFSWYYLNTYVTNRVEGKIYIVDGQQRLTTLTLILIKLKHKSLELSSDLRDWIAGKITGHAGYKRQFWMNHEQHNGTLKDLDDGKPLGTIETASGLTAVNMVKNYRVIDTYIDKHLNDLHKFDRFVFYFLQRLVMINLNVEQTDVPMIFEVINDRGVKLKPYEILKGKLLGQIQKEELEALKLNELWDDQVAKINSYADDEIDKFFISFLRSKFANAVSDAKKFDIDYHRILFTPDFDLHLSLENNPKKVKEFLLGSFKYYTSLYAKMLDYYNEENPDYPHVFYNGLTDMNRQFLLVMSACKLNDPQEKEKIQLISYEVDKLFSLLQLQKSYDSNAFNEVIYKISSKIRDNHDLDDISAVFSNHLKKLISENRGVTTSEEFTYPLFKETGIELEKRFKRYFFARIEKFIADNTNMQMKHSLADLVLKTGPVNGFHIEHILSVNNENLALFGNDEEVFERERNRLGGLLLLKGADNISSSNELYKNKLKTYANTLYWNETLRQDSYKSKLDFRKMITNYKLNFRPMDTFGPDQLEERQKLLFLISSRIWD
ncbi:DUF262 domain-containing protein [Planococcus sp. MERTA32b]|nr:DUF262 domain-containing protein [Planococcus sp. MER TA 32b]